MVNAGRIPVSFSLILWVNISNPKMYIGNLNELPPESDAQTLVFTICVTLMPLLHYIPGMTSKRFRRILATPRPPLRWTLMAMLQSR